MGKGGARTEKDLGMAEECMRERKKRDDSQRRGEGQISVGKKKEKSGEEEGSKNPHGFTELCQHRHRVKQNGA